MAVPSLGFVLPGVDVKLLLYRCKSTLSLQLYGFCLKEGKFTASLLVPPKAESTGNPSGKVLTCLLFLFLSLSLREASLQTGRAAERERESELARLHMQQLPLPQQKLRQRAEPGLSASQRL